MALGNKKMKERVAKLLREASENAPEEFKALAAEWIEKCNDADETKRIAAALKPMIAAGAQNGCEFCKELQTLDHYLVKRSQWIIGGDGASYDIGYGGLDHIIASGEDVNILVLVRTSTSSCSILRFTLTPVVRPLRLLLSALSLSSQPRVSASARRISV